MPEDIVVTGAVRVDSLAKVLNCLGLGRSAVLRGGPFQFRLHDRDVFTKLTVDLIIITAIGAVSGGSDLELDGHFLFNGPAQVHRNGHVGIFLSVTFSSFDRADDPHFRIGELPAVAIGPQGNATKPGQHHPHHGQDDGDPGKGITGPRSERALATHSSQGTNQSATAALLQQDDHDHQAAINDHRPGQA